MRVWGILVLVGLWLSAVPGTILAHSAMYPDQYKFDQSNEGRKAQHRFKSIQGKQTNKTSTACVDGLAGDFPCRNVDLQAFLVRADLGGNGAQLNDIWGWTDLATGVEVAIVGQINGTSFVDISDPVNPVLIGFLPSHNNGSDSWRDIKVYQDHAYIVADGSGNNTHGLQVFDLTQLASTSPGSQLQETAHLGGFGRAHNIAINEDSGFAYVVGSNQCSGGLYMVDISEPTAPNFAGCFSGDGYTHDTQCVIYSGPDTRFTGNEICFAYNEDSLTIVDVTDKANPVQLARQPYVGSQYTHQGWLVSDNQSYALLNDELDEIDAGINTTTHIFDVRSLTGPRRIGAYTAETGSIDHNLYVRDGLVYESNYRSGLRILDSSQVASANLEERAFFDTIPCSDSSQFSGTWSNYPYFASGNVVVSDIGTGLFILRPSIAGIENNANAGAAVTSPACSDGGSNSPTPPADSPTDSSSDTSGDSSSDSSGDSSSDTSGDSSSDSSSEPSEVIVTSGGGGSLSLAILFSIVLLVISTGVFRPRSIRELK